MKFQIIKRPDNTYYFTAQINSASFIYYSYEDTLKAVADCKKALTDLNSLCIEEVIYDSQNDKLVSDLEEKLRSVRVTE